jgi:hypothetical protein
MWRRRGFCEVFAGFRCYVWYLVVLFEKIAWEPLRRCYFIWGVRSEVCFGVVVIAFIPSQSER